MEILCSRHFQWLEYINLCDSMTQTFQNSDTFSFGKHSVYDFNNPFGICINLIAIGFYDELVRASFSPKLEKELLNRMMTFFQSN